MTNTPRMQLGEAGEILQRSCSIYWGLGGNDGAPQLFAGLVLGSFIDRLHVNEVNHVDPGREQPMLGQG